MSRRPTALALAALLAAPAAAEAQRPGRWTFGLEAGGGTMVRDFDRDGPSAETPALALASRFGLRIAGPFAAQLGGTFGRFVRARRSLPLVGATLGLRFAPSVGATAVLRVDANAGVYVPGAAVAFGVDLGAALEFRVGTAFSVGPFARFTHVWEGRAGVATPLRPYAPTAAQDTSDIAWWVVGVSFTVERRAAAPAPSPPAARGAEEPSP